MATPTPNPLYFACFPLQEYFVNKDTGFPLAGGYVEFFSDPAFTVPKDVFQQSLVGGTTYDYTNLGSVLVLSSVGTFVDNNGDDIIPFLYPYDANGEVELYFVRVWSGNPSVQGSVLQFTRQGWPPNLIQSTSPSDVFESSLNLFTNPQFSIVNFNNTSGQTYYEITVAGAGNFEFAPGWSIYYAGAGSLKIGQYPLTADWPTNPSYYLEIISDIGVTPITLRQRLDKSPRVFENNYLSVAMLAACVNNIAEVLTIDYVVNGGTSKQVLSATVPNNSTFGLLAGVANAPVLIDVTNNTAPDTGYVEMQVSVPSGRTMRYTSLFGCTVQNATSLVSGTQSTNAQQTNGMFWYYKPQLAYKPIPSYTLGWDFAMNPFQAQGTSAVTYNPTAPGKSAYIADQTILFQSTVNRIRASKASGTLNLEVVNGNTSFALVQYLGPNEAMELLNSPVCTQLRAKIDSGTLVGQVNLYYTTAATLPSLSGDSAVGGDSLVTAVNTTTGAPTISAGWTAVPRSDLSTAYFTLSSTMTNFNYSGWSTNVTNATFFAVVISFAEAAQNKVIQVQHCSLQKGYIPTAPAALSFGETLTGLQQYYEKSYEINVLPKAITVIGSYAYVAYLVGGVSPTNPQFALTVTYKVSKRATPSFTASPTTYSNMGILSPNNGSYSVVYEQGVANRPVDTVISSQNNFWFTVDATSISLHKTIEFQFVADARFGVQN